MEKSIMKKINCLEEMFDIYGEHLEEKDYRLIKIMYVDNNQKGSIENMIEEVEKYLKNTLNLELYDRLYGIKQMYRILSIAIEKYIKASEGLDNLYK